ncbi:hypothetical protein, partial [Burkholderia gladioli]|uniref:hypothetical protein n=1 Tax=Burkholderia gladioli TaxID=28095 RepID=UPI001ABA0609
RSLQRVASAQRPEILLAARVSPTGKFSNLSVTACPVMQGQVQQAGRQLLAYPLFSGRVVRVTEIHEILLRREALRMATSSDRTCIL